MPARRLAGAGAGVLALGAAIAFFALRDEADKRPSASGAASCPSSYAEPDPADIVASHDGPEAGAPVRSAREVDLGDRPAVTVTGREGIWVGQQQGLALIDPEREAQLGNVIGTESGVYAIALAEDRVWATLRNGTLIAVDRTTREIVGEPVDYGSDAGDVAVGAGGIWVNNYGVEALDGHITRIDPCTSELERIRVGRSAVTVDYGAGAIWVSDPTNEAIARVDPATREVETLAGFTDPQDLGVADDAVWVVQYADQSVQRVDPEALEERGPAIRVGPDPGGIATGDDQLWFPLYGNGTATRVDPESERSQVGFVRVGKSPTDATMGFGRVWIPNNGEDNVSVIGS